MNEFDIETVLVEATRLPMVNIDRELFLRKELKNKYSPDVVNLAVKENPACAGIKVCDIDKIAKSCIDGEAMRVAAISAVAGIPGGPAMIGTVPVDIAQYFGHILRILQELIYLYGWRDLNLKSDELDEETKNLLILFIGIMFGVNGAIAAVNKVAEKAAEQIAKKLPQEALTKGIIYPIVKKIAELLGVKMTKEIFAKGVAKIVPLIGGAVSGVISYASYKPMAKRLQKYLQKSKLADPKFMNDGITDNLGS